MTGINTVLSQLTTILDELGNADPRIAVAAQQLREATTERSTEQPTGREPEGEPRPTGQPRRSKEEREKVKGANRELAAWLREQGVTPNGPAWKAAKEGERSVAKLRQLQGSQPSLRLAHDPHGEEQLTRKDGKDPRRVAAGKRAAATRAARQATKPEVTTKDKVTPSRAAGIARDGVKAVTDGLPGMTTAKAEQKRREAKAKRLRDENKRQALQDAGISPEKIEIALAMAGA